jgi:hypothetical protein
MESIRRGFKVSQGGLWDRRRGEASCLAAAKVRELTGHFTLSLSNQMEAVRATAARLTKFCMRRAAVGLLFIIHFITILPITIPPITIPPITIQPITIPPVTIPLTLYYRLSFVSTVCLRISNLFSYLPNRPLTPWTSYYAMLKPTQNQLVMPL